MKNFFEKGNPFVSKDENNGEETKVMSDEIKENEIVEENNDEIIEETSSEEVTSTDEPVVCEVDKLKEDFNNLNNQYLRLAADFDNFRKRQVQEREALLKYGKEECMKKIIEVVDNFDRAIQSVEKIDDLEKMKEAFFVLNKQLTDSLTKLGLEQIKCVGEKFDPNLHEAVMQTPSEEYEEDTIINELQKGYKLGDKVLRASMVNVATK